MTQYDVILTLKREHTGDGFTKTVKESDLAKYHAVTAVDHQHRAQIIITIDAADLPQSVAKAQEVLNSFEDRVSLDVTPTAE